MNAARRKRSFQIGLPADDAATRSRLLISVVVPTYRRTEDLERCLDALERQTRPADRVFVVCRDNDEQTNDFLASWRTAAALDFEVVHVHEPGQVAALNAGLQRVRDGIVSFTDDDAAPRPEWLARIEAHFSADPATAGVGGRDYIAGALPGGEMTRVGIIQWFGRPIGNHHCGTGAARYVDVLKGANMSYRMSAVQDVRFDKRLRGAGAQRNNDLAFSLALRKRGWKLVYDPAVSVDHYPGNRVDGVERSELSRAAIRDGSYNETLSLLEFLPRQRAPFFLIWAILVGTRDLPGVAQCARNVSKHPAIWQLFVDMVRARFEAVRSLSGPQRP